MTLDDLIARLDEGVARGERFGDIGGEEWIATILYVGDARSLLSELRAAAAALAFFRAELRRGARRDAEVVAQALGREIPEPRT